MAGNNSMQVFALEDGTMTVGRMRFSSKKGRPSITRYDDADLIDSDKFATIKAMVKMGIRSNMSKDQVIGLVEEEFQFDDSLRAIFNNVKSRLKVESEALDEKKKEFEEVRATIAPLDDKEEAFLTALRSMDEETLKRQAIFSKVCGAACNYLIVLKKQSEDTQLLEAMMQVLSKMEMKSFSSSKDDSFLK